LRLGHIGLFVLTASLGATLGLGSSPVVPYGLNDSKTSVPATVVPTSLLSGPLSCEQGSPPWSFSLPPNAATATAQATGNASLASIDSKLPAPVSGRVPVDGSGVTQPVSLSSLPLPAGAATAALQSAANALLTSLDSKSPGLVSGRVPVDPSGVTSPVSITALPLPAGAATSALQLLGNASAASLDAKSPALVGGRVPVDGSGVTQPVSAVALPLPAGASTSALQTSANSLLSSLDGKAPALVGGRVPVDGSAVTQPVSGTFWPNTQPTSSAAGSQADGHSATLGSLADPSSANTVIGLLKALKVLLGGGLPPAGVGNRLDVNIGSFGATAVTVGQNVSANSLPVVVASDQPAVAVKGGAANGAAVSGNPVLIAGTDGTYARSIQTDGSGRPIAAGASNFQYVSTNTTTVHRAGAGIFRRAVIANLAASPSCITYYDNTAASGTVIGQVCPSSAAPGYSVVYDVRFTNGLTSIQAGATAGGYTTVWDQ
jgi:hypothetical protein